ncbi:VacJ family lipoprotein [Novosphingobium nitrogenifigens DSM 19370]|uniref:VacJ family lipoprotein n=1 Tax=Novosphingobium nitrogenifigens DSM 19370 TaxID=983920 RepID=F1Z3M8_9SPHN|nr:VacJ family lipoprotein [Novosphingobium nitrogenifigens DSM 19370]
MAGTAAASAQPGNTPPATKTGGKNEIVVSGKNGASKIDPLMSVNQTTYRVMESVDKAIVAPIAKGYRKQVPSPIRRGLHNFFFNLNEPVNAINFVLQLKPLSALKTVGRFGLNSTIGVGGLLDVAKTKPFKLHYRPNGLGNTFGYYGIGPGAFLFLPGIGPTSVRDLIGSILDQVVVPFAVGSHFNTPWFVIPANIVQALDYRVGIDEDLEKVREAKNPYIYYRQLYFRNRFEEIEALHGRGPLARGQIGMAPFAHPLYPEPTPPALVPEPAGAAPAVVAPPAAGAAPSGPTVGPVETPPASPPAPPPPVFVAHPVVQPLPAGA